VTVTVTNPGTVVEGYRLQVLGPTAPWAEVVPPEVSVYPQQEVTAAVVFSPPTGTSAPGGLQPFGVIARSTLNPQVSAVAEGDVEIGQVYGLQAKIVPVTSAGRWRGRHVIPLSNWGNAPAQLRLTASDPDDALGFYVSPEIVTLPPGGQVSVRITARTKKPFLRGTPARPVPGGRVEDHLDVANTGLAVDQRAQRRVHLVDHIVSLAIPLTPNQPPLTRLGGIPDCPIGHLSRSGDDKARRLAARPRGGTPYAL
jgi:hypothetical protein